MGDMAVGMAFIFGAAAGGIATTVAWCLAICALVERVKR